RARQGKADGEDPSAVAGLPLSLRGGAQSGRSGGNRLDYIPIHAAGSPHAVSSPQPSSRGAQRRGDPEPRPLAPGRLWLASLPPVTRDDELGGAGEDHPHKSEGIPTFPYGFSSARPRRPAPAAPPRAQAAAAASAAVSPPSSRGAERRGDPEPRAPAPGPPP